VDSLAITFPLDEIVRRVLEALPPQAPEPMWMTRKAAAAYLSLGVSTLEKDKSVPCHRYGDRVLYNREELDRWALALSA
jgi:hypothetical protein